MVSRTARSLDGALPAVSCEHFPSWVLAQELVSSLWLPLAPTQGLAVRTGEAWLPGFPAATLRLGYIMDCVVSEMSGSDILDLLFGNQ